MLNERQTLKKLHEAFPEMTLDNLFKILDCYVDTYQLSAPHWDLGVRPLNTNISYDKTVSKPDYTTSQTCACRSIEF